MRRLFTWGNKRPRRLCFAVGLYTAGYFIFDHAYAPIVHNSRSPLDIKSRYGKGSWAVISGATDPLGVDMANHLASKGFKLYLLDTNRAELDKLASNLALKTEVKSKEFDFLKVDSHEPYESLCKSIHEECGDISMLVNNVERRDPLVDRFHDTSDEDLIKLLNVNSFPITFLTRFLGPGMKKRDKKCAIVNMTGSYSVYPSPYLPVYSASKGFQQALSECLGFEN
jgi:short-subunit dehydrogenase